MGTSWDAWQPNNHGMNLLPSGAGPQSFQLAKKQHSMLQVDGAAEAPSNPRQLDMLGREGTLATNKLFAGNNDRHGGSPQVQLKLQVAQRKAYVGKVTIHLGELEFLTSL